MSLERFSVPTIQKLQEDFNSQLISKTAWTHEAHLLVAISFVKQYDEYEAICRMKSGIILLNKEHATANDGNGGYHETLTVFWVKVIKFFRDSNPDFNACELANAFFDSKLSERNLPMVFYEKDELMSTMYRAVYTVPVKMPLIQASINFLLVGKD